MKITFVGTGYVGLVTGTCFAEVGNHVVCVDIDEQKIERLRQGILPIYEPGLADIVSRNYKQSRLTFTTDLTQAIAESEIIFVAVGTPQLDDGSCNLNYVWSVIDQIREVATEPKIVVCKSTVPVGTNSKLLDRLNSGSIKHSVASNPEFLREGLAVGDCLRPDRVVIGIRDQFSREKLSELYQPFADQGVPIVFMKPESSEMTKYVANCVLATKISYINEMANMCEVVGADVNDVREGIGHDPRIGFKFFAPGVGYGGSCFPKDVRAMKALAREYKMPMRILEAVDYINETQKQVAFQKLVQLLGEDLTGKTVGVWGLAFKPETDDIREAPSIVLIKRLLQAGATIQTFDEQATENVQQVFGDAIQYADNQYAAVDGADALVIMTEWKSFRDADFEQLRDLLKHPLIVDGRNLFDPEELANHGFTYASIGRETISPRVPVLG